MTVTISVFKKIITTPTYDVIREILGSSPTTFTQYIERRRHILLGIVQEKMSALLILIDSTNRFFLSEHQSLSPRGISRAGP